MKQASGRCMALLRRPYSWSTVTTFMGIDVEWQLPEVKDGETDNFCIVSRGIWLYKVKGALVYS